MTKTEVRKKVANVLIVDDSNYNLYALEEILSSDDINILKASSGNEALNCMLEKDIAIVLLDIQMPDMNGFEVAEIMRSYEKTRNIPIIFITGINKEEDYIFRGYECGAVDYIYKPIKNEILKSKVKVFINLHNQKQIIANQNFILKDKVEELNKIKKKLETANEKLWEMANMDGLTTIPNRRSFDIKLPEEVKRMKRERKPLSLMMVDIDYFKKYNDHYGHIKGDDVLKDVANMLDKAVKRPGDFVGRYGGEEFVVLLPDTNLEGAKHISIRIMQELHAMKIEHKKSEISKFISVSIGISVLNPDDKKTTPQQLVNKADIALYIAKNKGRNRIEVHEDSKI